MANAPQWSTAAIWLGKELARDRGWFAANVKRDAAAAGFTPHQLATAFAAIDADVSSDGATWFLNEQQRAYWRKYGAAQSILAPAAATPPAPGSCLAVAAAPKIAERAAVPALPTSPAVPRVVHDGGLAAHTEKCLANPHMRAQAGLAPIAAPASVPRAPTETSAQIFARRKEEMAKARGR